MVRFVYFACNEILFSIKKKEGNPLIFDNMNEPGRHYAKGKQPDRERQRLHGLTYKWNLKEKKEESCIYRNKRKAVAGS